MVGHGGSSAGSYFADPTSPIPSHCAVIILFKSVAVHQLSWLALKELKNNFKWAFCDAQVNKRLSPTQITLSNLQPEAKRSKSFSLTFDPAAFYSLINMEENCQNVHRLSPPQALKN